MAGLIFRDYRGVRIFRGSKYHMTVHVHGMHIAQSIDLLSTHGYNFCELERNNGNAA